MPHPKNRLGAIRTLLNARIAYTPERATAFFKTGKGAYAEHDTFLGVPVPALRAIAKQCHDLPLPEIQQLLGSCIHEERFLALLLLIAQYQDRRTPDPETRYHCYVEHLSSVNNWDLVDISAHHLMGHYLWDRPRTMLLTLAGSENLWYRRISIVATWYFIRQSDLPWTFKIATRLCNDPADLIHKAVGWMLREAGKRDHPALRTWLDQHAAHMPRTMLRYAIEKFPEPLRKQYLQRS